MIEHVRGAFPTVTRVTTYGRAATLARRRPSELALLAAAGLTRVHVGMESGSDEVLARVEKGCTAAQLVAAGRAGARGRPGAVLLRHAGAGRPRPGDEHVRGTAAVLREVAAAATPARPLVVRLRTTAVVPGTPLADDEAAGRFVLPDDVEIAAELRALLELLDGVRLELRSDHALNLMPGLAGSLPRERAACLAALDEFLALPAAEQAELALEARVGRASTGRPARPAAGTALQPPVAGSDDAETAAKLEAAKRLRAQFL